MRKTWPVVSGIVVILVIGGIALAQMSGSMDKTGVTDGRHMGCRRGWRGTVSKGSESFRMGSDKMPCGMTDRGMMHSYLCCPMMSTHSSVGYFLSHSEGIELSEGQVKSLEAIRDSYQEERTQEIANLETAMSELHSVLSEDEIDLSEASDLNERIETIRTRVRFKEIEAFAKAKRVLSGEQLERLRSLDAGSSQHESHHGMMHR